MTTVFHKRLDRSMFHWGTPVPRELLDVVVEAIGAVPAPGEAVPILLAFRGTHYVGYVRNLRRSGVQGDTVHVRYDGNKPLQMALRDAHSGYFAWVEAERERRVNAGAKRPRTDTSHAPQIDIQALGQGIIGLLDTPMRAEQRGVMGGDSAVRDDPATPELEDLTRWTLHKRLDRNRHLALAAKRHHGSRCQVCNFDFEVVYGPLGSGYIEAHHLVPIHQLGDGVVELDPVTDFAVLCSNCHRMVHRLENPDALDKLRTILQRNVPSSADNISTT